MKLKIFVRIEPQMVVESLLVVSVAAFELAVVPRRPRPDRLVADVKALTEECPADENGLF